MKPVIFALLIAVSLVFVAWVISAKMMDKAMKDRGLITVITSQLPGAR